MAVPHDKRSLEHLIARSPVAPPAREAFRDSLRRSFVSGALASETLRSRGAVPGARRPSPLRYVAAGLLAAAAALALWFVLPWHEVWREGWVVVGGKGTLLADGRPVREDADRALRQALESGAPLVLRTEGQALDLELEGRLTVHVLPQSTLRIAGTATASDEPLLGLDVGEMYLWKVAESAPFTVRTPEEEIRVLGTTLGVMSGDGLTCTCLVEGHAEVDSRLHPFSFGRARERTSHQVWTRAGAIGEGAMPFPDETAIASGDPRLDHVANLVVWARRR